MRRIHGPNEDDVFTRLRTNDADGYRVVQSNLQVVFASAQFPFSSHEQQIIGGAASHQVVFKLELEEDRASCDTD